MTCPIPSFVLFLTVLALLGFAGGDRCLGEPPPATSSADASTFDVIAKDIEKTVLRLGYPKSTADDLVRLVRGWNCEVWKQNLARARAGSSSDRSAEVARVEEEAIESLYERIGKEIALCDEKGTRYFYLSAVVKDRKAQCLGYSQVFYILGNSVGLTVRVVKVLEMVVGSVPSGTSHAACLVERSDGRTMIVDVTTRYFTKPFVFKEEFVEVGNYWQLKRPDNPLPVCSRIQVWNENGLVACIYSSLAIVYADAGHPEQALSYCSKAIGLDPGCAEAFVNRGKIYGMLGQKQQAISDCNKAIELNPKDAIAFYNRGVTYSRLGHNQLAVADYSKAIELNPKYAEAFANRGLTYSRLGQHQQAISDCNKAIELNSKLAEAFTNRGSAYGGLGRYQEAIADFNKVIELNPKAADAFYNRGAAYCKLGQHQQSILDYNKVIELIPEDARAYTSRGYAKALLGKTDDAKRDLQKALALDSALRPQIQRISDHFKLGL